MIDNQCKKCRRAGQKLFLKGERCFGQKCAMVRRAYAPGVHGKRHRRISEYGAQLAEKQKVRFSYGVSEKQFKNYFLAIKNQKGNKEELFIQQLEKRLDNVVYRLGLAGSRNLSRQVVSHGHIVVNGRKTNIASYQVKKDDVVTLRPGSVGKGMFKDLATSLKKHEAPKWLKFDIKKMEGVVIREPAFEDAPKVGELSMIIEYYSR